MTLYPCVFLSTWYPWTIYAGEGPNCTYLRCMGETGVWVGGAEMDLGPLGLTAAVEAGISDLGGVGEHVASNPPRHSTNRRRVDWSSNCTPHE